MHHFPIAAGMSNHWLREAVKRIAAEQAAAAETSPATKAALQLTHSRIEQLAYQPSVDTTGAVESFVEAARIHGENSEPDHEVGDLQDLLRAIWRQLTPAQRATALRSSEVSQVLEGAGQQPLATRDEDVTDWDQVCDFYGLDTSFQYGADAVLEFANMFRLEGLRPGATAAARYVHGTWEHIFMEGHSPAPLRLVYDREERRIIAMELKRRAGWEPANEMQIADVQDSLKNANPEAISAPDDYGLQQSQEPPAWCSPHPERCAERQRL